MRKTKIIATFGPASNSLDTAKKLIEAGVDAARINFSHGDHESHGKTIEIIKKARTELNKPIPIILDTKGPEVRVKKFKTEPVKLEENSIFTLTTDDILGDETKASVTYNSFAKDLSVGNTVLIDDGLIELKVEKIENNDVICKVINSGFVYSNKGVNVPGVHLQLPALTQKDIEDIKFGIENDFDYIAASFIRCADDIIQIRQVLEENNGTDIKIIAKIENRDGVDNIEEIMELADGIMIARGDLGVEIPLEEVPMIQKELIKKCNKAGKPVITATQMLESMVNNPRPTRAEANDVANAIYDGSDAIMLSGETAKGSFPVEAVKTMVRIANKVEGTIDYVKENLLLTNIHLSNITNAISHAACTTANDLNACCIIAVSSSGFTARKVSQHRPSCPIMAYSPFEKVVRQLNLLWGCYPHIIEHVKTNSSDLFALATDVTHKLGMAKAGDVVVLVGGTPVGTTGTTNTLKVQIVGDIILKGKGIGNKIISGRANVVQNINDIGKYFKKGDILVTKTTNNALLPYMKKASAIIVGSGKPENYSHAETVGIALDIPVIICNDDVTGIIQNSILLTLDCKKGLIYNGTR